MSSDPHPEQILLPYLEEASAEATRRGVALELHFERLEYCSSATLAVLVDFIQRRAGSRGKVICIFDVTRRWQRLSLEALRMFEDESGTFELRTTRAD